MTVENRATLEKSSKEQKISGVWSSNKSRSKIFRLLRQDQSDQVKEWREKKGKRLVAALMKHIKDECKSEMKKKRGDNKESDEVKSRADFAAGKEFSCGAHNKKQHLRGHT
jgi:hypothetical protein